jgi:hypothetical protein
MLANMARNAGHKKARQRTAKVTTFFAATSYEGCGHRHFTARAARKCLRRVTGPRKGVYMVVSERPFKSRPASAADEHTEQHESRNVAGCPFCDDRIAEDKPDVRDVMAEAANARGEVPPHPLAGLVPPLRDP